MEEINTYSAHIFCKNCALHTKIEIAKGKLTEDSFCPDCGCKELKLDPNGWLSDRNKRGPNPAR